MADKLFTAHNHGMTGIVTALKPNHHISIFGQ
jgi:hypothetical protein